MIATSHVIIGGAIGVAIGNATGNPTLASIAALGAGIISHLACDSIPHLDAPFKIEYENGQKDRPIWDRRLVTFAAADSTVAFLLTLLIWSRFFDFNFTSPYAWGALGAYLPDFVDNVPFWSDKIRSLSGFRQFHKIHISTHTLWLDRFPMNKHWMLGIFTQLAVALPCLYFLIK